MRRPVLSITEVDKMWSWMAPASRTVGRKDEQLARYARWEYGGDGGWFVAQARSQARGGRREAPRSRWAGLFKRPVGEDDPHPTDSVPCATASDGGVHLEAPQAAPLETCGHETLEWLGEGGSASYFRCGACGVLLIAQGGSLWTLARSPGEGP